MLSLVSVSSKSAGLHDYVAKNHPERCELMNTEFAQGDVVTTIIKCAGGETITLTLDTQSPRFSTRDLKVIGTNATYEAATKTVFIDDGSYDHETNISSNMNNTQKLVEKYDHPLWREYEKSGIRAGHGGMDWLILCDFFDALREGRRMPIDVYDMASWMAISALSEKSISLGSRPVDIPDFTCGKWIFE